MHERRGAWIDDEKVYAETLSSKIERDTWELIAMLEDDDTTFAMIECARFSPQMGVATAFTFGRDFGAPRMEFGSSGNEARLIQVKGLDR